MKVPKVFISYAHSNKSFNEKVLEFSNKLRNNGIDANIDQYEESPNEGWQRWMEKQIRNSDFVLIVSNSNYYNKIYDEIQKTKGINWEVNIVYQNMYDNKCLNDKYIPAVFDDDEKEYILTPLKPFTYYNISSEDNFKQLFNRLCGIPNISKPILGELKPLSSKEAKTLFVTTPINLEKRDKAKWSGTAYVWGGSTPILCLLFQNYEIAKEIFTEWRNITDSKFADEFLQVDFIVPPFGDYIISHAQYNKGNGYWISIGSNLDQSINRAVESGITPEELLLFSVDRNQWMNEKNGNENRLNFKKHIENGGSYKFMPMGLRELENPSTINFDEKLKYSINMKKAFFTTGIEALKNDRLKILVTSGVPNIPL